MNEKIKIIIADDNKPFCKNLERFLKRYEEIEILALAHTDEEEIQLIEYLKPDIVITDLMRNHQYTGLDIIKQYINKKNSPQFLVISADRKEDVIDEDLEIGGYVEKPFWDYNIIFKEIETIKEKEKRKKYMVL